MIARPLFRLSRPFLFSHAKDYYQVLALPRNATFEQLKESYLHHSKLTHPDSSTGSQEQFIQVQEAYNTLNDALKRKNYDRTIGIEISEWEQSEYSLKNTEFQNQSAFAEILSEKINKQIKETAEETLGKRFHEELHKEKGQFTGFIVPGVLACGMWMLWEVMETVVFHYSGDKEYESRSSEEGKKFSSFVVEIR